MGNLVAAFICGLLFGSGLQISGMTDPNKIFGFLDFFGTWDPSLALVMATAVVTTAIGYVLAHQRGKPVLAGKNAWPTKTQIDSSLMIGAVIFGTGWGLVGLCPGPALVNLTSLSPKIAGFVAAVALGMVAASEARARILGPAFTRVSHVVHELKGGARP